MHVKKVSGWRWEKILSRLSMECPEKKRNISHGRNPNISTAVSFSSRMRGSISECAGFSTPFAGALRADIPKSQSD
jgi:hypothetical protein